MKITILADNMEYGTLPGEWGFCAYIEYGERKLLLDTGASDLFVQNAEKLGLSLKEVDMAFLSHAHYDHANGMERFFEENKKAAFYLQKSCQEDCYYRRGNSETYIGMPKGILARFKDRIEYVTGVCEPERGIYLLPHSLPHLEQIGEKEGMYRKTKEGWKPDDFSHEQSLVLETASGLVILNSCSHGGVVNIINEVKAVFPETKIAAFVGGFHIFEHSKDEIRALASEMKETETAYFYTGHCSKERGVQILKEELGERVRPFYVGFEIEML